MNSVGVARRAKVTDETREEARKLKDIWSRSAQLSQAEFGKRYAIGTQGAVAHFLGGTVPLSLKAARGFAEGLGCAIGDFSPRLAAQAASLAPFAPATPSRFVHVRLAHVDQGHVVYKDGCDYSPMQFCKDYLRSLGATENNTLIVAVTGRDNEPEITDGAILLVNQLARAYEHVRDGKFYAFRHEGALRISRLYRQRGRALKAVAANPDKALYPDVTVDADAPSFQILGRVFWIGAEI